MTAGIDESPFVMTRGFLLVFLFLTLGSVAKEQALLTTSSDKDDRVASFAVDVDDKGALTRLWQRETSSPARAYSLAQLKEGVVLKMESGKEVVRFQAIKVDPKKGGSFRLDYLYSGVPPEEYKSLFLELKRQDGKWKLFTKSDKRALTSLRFKTNVTSFMGIKKIIGIRSIEFSRES